MCRGFPYESQIAERIDERHDGPMLLRKHVPNGQKVCDNSQQRHISFTALPSNAIFQGIKGVKRNEALARHRIPSTSELEFQQDYPLTGG